MRNTVAIVGRPNVGKSTLFNRLVQKREAIIDAESGVTRDRNYGISDWNGHDFSVIDTGGYVDNNEDVFQAEIDKQVKLAIEEADVILFMVDAQIGINPLDEGVAKLLRGVEKPVFLTVNKVDNPQLREEAVEFYNLGLGEYYAIAGTSGSGTGDLLDAVVATFPERDPLSEDNLPRFAVIGRPNAGKSSFINTLIGEERYIVTDVAGTTRDSSDTVYDQFGFKFKLVDTAGIRRKSKVEEDLEFYSVRRSIRALEYADVCLLVVDVTRGFDRQVQNIFWLAAHNRKGIVILVNKWDLIEDKKATIKHAKEVILGETEPFWDLPVIFVSVKEKQRIYKAMETAVQVFQDRKQKIKTHKLNEVLLPIIAKNPPPRQRGKLVKIKYITQLPTKQPQFAFYCNIPKYIKPPYKRFLENQLRKHFNLTGVPISIFIRQK